MLRPHKLHQLHFLCGRLHHRRREDESKAALGDPSLVARDLRNPHENNSLLAPTVPRAPASGPSVSVTQQLRNHRENRLLLA